MRCYPEIGAVLLAVLCVAIEPARAEATYPAGIEYAESASVLFDETQFLGWPAGSESKARHFSFGEVSADGSRLAFAVAVPVGNGAVWHLFSASADGTQLTDHTAAMPQFWFAPFELNHDGTRLFFVGEASQSIQYLSIPGGVVHPAVTGCNSLGPPRSYCINGAGTRVYFRHYSHYEPGEMRHYRGIYSAEVGTAPTEVMNCDQLPCGSACDSILNFLKPVGMAADESRFVFSYEEDYYNSSPTAGMWQIASGGAPAKVPNELHDYVWALQEVNNHVVSADGNEALYFVGDGAVGLYSVAMASGQKTLLATSKPDAYLSISPDGDYACFWAANHRATRVHIPTLAKRDTDSYHLEGTGPEGWRTDFTADNRFYYFTQHSDLHRLYRMSMGQMEPDRAPVLEWVAFTKPYLLDQPDGRIGIEVKVSPSSSGTGLDWVRLAQLVEGKEAPDFDMGRDPLAFPTGDPGSVLLRDDGTHGDRVPGDGVYSFDEIATRKGDYTGWNTWYTHYPLPNTVGIRIIARDLDQNYSLADTLLEIRADAGSGYAAWRDATFTSTPADQRVESANPDGDCLDNYDEYVADTDPEDRSSCLRIESITVGTDVRVALRTSAARVYTLQFAPDPAAGPWQDVGGQVRRAGNGALLEMVDAAPSPERYYRARVAFPP